MEQFLVSVNIRVHARIEKWKCIWYKLSIHKIEDVVGLILAGLNGCSICTKMDFITSLPVFAGFLLNRPAPRNLHLSTVRPWVGSHGRQKSRRRMTCIYDVSTSRFRPAVTSTDRRLAHATDLVIHFIHFLLANKKRGGGTDRQPFSCHRIANGAYGR